MTKIDDRELDKVSGGVGQGGSPGTIKASITLGGGSSGDEDNDSTVGDVGGGDQHFN